MSDIYIDIMLPEKDVRLINYILEGCVITLDMSEEKNQQAREALDGLCFTLQKVVDDLDKEEDKHNGT